MRIIRGKFGRRRFDVPANITARPTTDFARENIFNVLENIVDFEGKDALDLFAGTGAVSFEFLSRECRSVTAVERAPTQQRFIQKVADELGTDNFTLVRGDALRFIANCPRRFDIVFADPPYDMKGFGEIPSKILSSRLVGPGSIVIVEHSRSYDFSALPGFSEHRVYGSVNFSIFRIESEDSGIDENIAVG
jgi:16S rRNA (guanine(966)-N(2))-methyltransferase RsmD